MARYSSSNTTDRLAGFNCPLCGSTQAFVVCVPRPNGVMYATAFLECGGCTVMFRDVQRFMWLTRHHKDPTDPRGLHYVDAPQRALDGLNKGASVADKLAEPASGDA
jgi:hypothetical protein